MVITDNFVFIELPRTGSTHTKNLLLRLLHGRRSGMHNAASPQILADHELFLGTVRNPWDWYVSKWTIGCGRSGALHARATRDGGRVRGGPHDGRIFDPTPWREAYSDYEALDVDAFRHWLRLLSSPEQVGLAIPGWYGGSGICAHSGFYSYCYTNLFCRNRAALADREKLTTQAELLAFVAEDSYLTHMARTENLGSELVAALLDMGVSLTADQSREIAEAPPSNRSHRSLSLEDLYDEESFELVRLRERLIIERHGYGENRLHQGCPIRFTVSAMLPAMQEKRGKWVSPEIRSVTARKEDPEGTTLQVLPETKTWRASSEDDVVGPSDSSRWNEACWLELDAEVMQVLGRCERWELVIRDSSEKVIYRKAGKDRAVLNPGEGWIAVDPVFVLGDDPRSFMVRAHHRDGMESEQWVRPVPESFKRRHGDLLSWIQSHGIPDRTASFCPIGGLANQLYQAAAMFGYSRRNDIPSVCEVWKKDSPSMVKRRPTYWDTVFSEIVKLGEGLRRDPEKARNYGDPSFTYTEIPVAHEHQILWGHYLSYRYFHPEREELLDLLWGNEAVQRKVDTAFERLQARLPPGAESLVSIHVRRGDSLLNKTLTLMNMRYWEEAMARFPRSVFAVFSDDIAWCREQFRRPDVLFVEGNPDWVDLYLMARCDHNIIVNSTYSWWSAYLNRNPNRRVIYPMPWFAGKKRERDMSDFFLPDWTEIEVHETAR